MQKDGLRNQAVIQRQAAQFMKNIGQRRPVVDTLGDYLSLLERLPRSASIPLDAPSTSLLLKSVDLKRQSPSLRRRRD
jgi:hypothetical protein